MIMRPGQRLLKVLATVLVLVQVAFSGLGALAHPGDRAGKVASVSATGPTSGNILHDELRCPLCQFASQQAEPVPACDIIACVTVQNAPVRTVTHSYAPLPPH